MYGNVSKQHDIAIMTSKVLNNREKWRGQGHNQPQNQYIYIYQYVLTLNNRDMDLVLLFVATQGMWSSIFKKIIFQRFFQLVGPSRRHRYRRNWAIRLHHAFSPRPPLAGESGLQKGTNMADQFEVTNIAPEGHFWPETIETGYFC